MAAALFGGTASMEELPHLSQNPGEGTGSMATLVQKQMTNILAPLVQRLVDLEDRSGELEAKTVGLLDEAKSSAARLTQHDRSLAQQAVEAAQTREALRRAEEQLVEMGEKQGALENDQDATRISVNRLEACSKTLASQISDYQRLQEDMDQRVRQLAVTLSEFNISQLNVNDRIQELRNRLEGLNERHMDLLKTAQELKQSDENSRAAIKRMAHSSDKQRRDLERSLVQVDDRCKHWELAVMELQNSDERAQKALKATKLELAQARCMMEGALGRPKAQEAAMAGGVAKSDISGRIGSVEDMVVKLANAISSDKTGLAHNLQQIQEVVRRMVADMGKSVTDIVKLDEKLKLQDNRCTKTEQFCAELYQRQDKLKDGFDASESDMKHLVRGVRVGLETKLETQAQEVAKAFADLVHVNNRVDVVKSHTEALRLDLTASNGTMVKLSQSIDLAHEYFHGLSKGFTDTHRKVIAGTEAFVPRPTKNITGSGGLPSIPNPAAR